MQLATAPSTALADGVQIATDILAEIDAACSRFRSDSELVRANAQAGRPLPVGPLLAAAVTVAMDAARQTSGLVDPTLGHALVAVGYDRDLALLPAAANDPAGIPRPSRIGAWEEIVLDRSGPDAVLTVPADCALDLGATGKAWAADLVARCIADATGADVVVSVGGDVAAVGGTSWPVGVSEVARPAGADATADVGRHTGPRQIEPSAAPGAPASPTEVVRLVAGGLATSTTSARRWVRGGQPRHHLLDPRTGEPTRGRWRTVSAFGRSAVAANTASTAAIVLGGDGWDWLVDREVAARLIDQNGVVHYTPSWLQVELTSAAADPIGSP